MENRTPPLRRSDIVAAVPVFGETGNLNSVLAGLSSLNIDVIVINDGMGTDLTAALRRDGHAVIEHSNNRGVGAAMLSGLAYSTENKYEGVLAVDADGAHHLNDIAGVLFRARLDHTKAVLTSRFGHLGDNYIPLNKRAANRFAARLFGHITGHDLLDVSSGLRYYPSSMANVIWRETRFGFIYETLNTMLLQGLIGDTLNIFVQYPDVGPYLTKRNELSDFTRFLLDFPYLDISLKEQLTQFCSTTVIPKESVTVMLEAHAFQFDFVPSLDHYLITDLTPVTDTEQPIPPDPKGKIAVGIIPDGGRRWSRMQRVSVRESYEVATDLILDFLTRHAQNLSACAVYLLSEYNLARDASELSASFACIDRLIESSHSSGCRNVYYGNLQRLPAPLSVKALGANRRASLAPKTQPLVINCLAFSAAWETNLLSPVGEPWDLNLTPALLQEIRDIRIQAIIRTGGARTLSEFLPIQSAYAIVDFESALFNDFDLNGWLENVSAPLTSAVYGT